MDQITQFVFVAIKVVNHTRCRKFFILINITMKKLIKSVLFAGFISLIPFSGVHSDGLDYKYPLYPYSRDLSQTLTFKIMLRCALPTDISNMDMALVANYLRQIDCITRGIPKVVILGGFQAGGHDHTYPWWVPVDPDFTAPGRRTGKDALIWLMNEAKKYNTTCTFHVNPFDAYQDSPKWDEYVRKDLICRNSDGSLKKGDVWWGRQSYMINMVNEWNAGITQQRIDALIEELPLVKETKVLYFDNLTQYPSSHYHAVSQNDQITAIKRAAQYLKEKYDIQLIGEYADPNLYGFDALGVTWDWLASLNVNQMEVPAYIACGGRNNSHDNLCGGYNDLSKRRLQVFGSSLQLEDIQFQNDPSKVVREFTHHTLVYFYLNRLLRESLTTSGIYGMELRLSDHVQSKWESDNVHRLYRDGKLMKEGYDVFMPVFWVNHREIMAYSYLGRTGIWDFPREWTDVTAVDIYGFDSGFYTLNPVRTNVPVSDNQINLTLEAGNAQIIVPAGTVLNDGTIYDRPASGTVTFIGRDDNTQGNWKNKYGSVAYDVFGASMHVPDDIHIDYIGDRTEIIDVASSRIRALQKPGDGPGRIEAVRTSTLHQIIDVRVPEKKATSLYFADYRDKNCQVAVDVIDVLTKQILHSNLINSFTEGTYLRYEITGNVQFRITRFFYDMYGNPDYPVCSGLFIDNDNASSIGKNTVESGKLICSFDHFGTLNIDATVNGTGNAILRVCSVAGNILYSENIPVVAGKICTRIGKDKSNLRSGVYIIVVKTDREILKEKIPCN